MAETTPGQQLLDRKMIYAAGKHNDLDRVRELLKAGANINGRLASGGSSALTWTSCGGNIALMDFLLSQGADVNAPGNFGFSPLGCAAFKGKAEAVQFLLASGADPNPAEPDGFGVMLSATFGASEEVARLLIKAGSQVNIHAGVGAHGPFWFNVPYCGETPLHHAMAYGSRGMIQALLDAGADCAAKTTHGETAFQWAGRHQRPTELLRWLHTIA